MLRRRNVRSVRFSAATGRAGGEGQSGGVGGELDHVSCVSVGAAGRPLVAARVLLIYAFVRERVDGIELVPRRAQLEMLVASRFGNDDRLVEP